MGALVAAFFAGLFIGYFVAWLEHRKTRRDLKLMRDAYKASMEAAVGREESLCRRPAGKFIFTAD